MFKKRNLIFLSLFILEVFLISGCWLIPTPTYIVTFDSQGGSAVNSQTVEEGGLAPEPTAPTKEGYTFAGWYRESGCTNAWYFANDTVTSDVTLYAKWTTNTYTVTFDKNGGDTEANPKIKTATYGGNVGTLPTAPTRTGYTFTSWNTEANGSGTKFKASTAVTANITVYAQWTINSYTVTYNGNSNTGGSVPVDPSSPYEYGETVTVSGNTGTLVKTGYTFDGWNTLANGTGTDQAEGSTFNMGASDVTLFAKWTPLYALRDTGPAGGLIFYVKEGGYSGGWMYLEAAPSDQSASAEWGCYETSISGADGTAVGTGEQNTIDIEAGCVAAGTAADICANLSLGGYDDWFLPSKDELNQMYVNLHLQGVGGFAIGAYWSSSEYSASSAWFQSFNAGDQFNGSKDTPIHVRAVRAF